MKKDELGNRMKANYEDRTRYYLPRRTYSIIRVDGKAFKTYTRGLKKPFDAGLIVDMDDTACYLCKNIQGAKFAFVQSDEISILMTDFDEIGTSAWFDGNIQKMVSVTASMATAKFNQLRLIRLFAEMDKYYDWQDTCFSGIESIINGETKQYKLAEFDARVFTLPSKTEVENYFLWRQMDTVRNSISSVAQSLYSHKELNGKNTSEQQEMIFQKGTNWNDFEPKLKRGRFIMKVISEYETPFVKPELQQRSYTRSAWKSTECPTFTQERTFLSEKIPDNL